MTLIEHGDEPTNADVSRLLVSRRRILSLSGLGIAAMGLNSACASEEDASPASGGAASAGGGPAAQASGACALTTEQIEGPYYIDGMLRRSNVVEDRVGVPLALKLRVIDSTTCQPAPDVAVEIWQCDSRGIYSGYASVGTGKAFVIPTGPPPTGEPAGGPRKGGGGAHVTPTDKLTYLRGLQMSDKQGNLAFQTLVPGWYTQRAVHIHVKVHTGGKASATGYTAGRICHTGQLYFAEELVTLLHALDPYRRNKTPLTTLAQDAVYDDSGSAGGLLDLQYDKKNIAAGVTGTLTMSIDPAATNEGGPPTGPPGGASGASAPPGAGSRATG